MSFDESQYFIDEGSEFDASSFFLDEEGSEDPTILSEAKGVGGRALEGVLDMLSFIENINPLQSGGPKLWGYGPGEQLKKAFGEDTGTAGDLAKNYLAENDLMPEPPKTTAGQILGEIGYYAPGLAFPGGTTKQAVLSTLGAGGAAGIAKASGAEEGGQALAGLFGALSPNIVQGGKRLVGKLFGSPIEEAGQALERNAIGARQTDYSKSAKEIGPWVDDVEDVETITKQTLNEISDSGALGTSRNPQRMLSKANEQEREVTKSIGTLIEAADEVRQRKVFPTFERARAYIKSRVPLNERTGLENELDELEKGFKNSENAGSLRLIQDQKVAFGTKYELGNEIRNGYYRALYGDLKNTLEKQIPGIKNLNKEERKWKIVRPILQRALGVDEGSTIEKTARGAIRTSGGYGSLLQPGLNAAFLGTGGTAIAGPAVGIGAAAIGAFLGTPGGRAVIGTALKNAGRNLKGSTISLDDLPIVIEALNREVSAESGNQEGQQETGQPKTIGQRLAELTAQDSQFDNLEDEQNIFPANDNQARPLSETPKTSQQQASKEEVAARALLNSLGQGMKESSSSFNSPTDLDPTQEAFERLKTFGYGDEMRGEDIDVESLVKAVIGQESGGKANALSPKGAQGLMQIMPETAKDIASELGYASYDLNDAKTNREFGTYYLRKMLDMFGDPKLALAAYNAGPGKVSSWIKQFGTANWDEIARKLRAQKAYAETIAYVPGVLKRLNQLNVVRV